MTKGKGGRGGGAAREGRQGKGRQGGKQCLSNPTLDTEMLDVPNQRNRQSRRSKQVQNKPCGDQTQQKNTRRGQVDKVARDVPQSRQSIFFVTSQATRSSDRADSSTPATAARNSFVTANGPQNPFVASKETKSRQTSVLSCVSALSTRVGRRAYCFKCSRTNRKLRQALFDLLERALNDGRNLIDEWSWEAGVSPDHMDCERTKIHTIPEGLQSGNEPIHGFQAGRTSVLPAQTSQAPGLLQPTLNPFIPARPSVSESQPPHMLAPQIPSAMPWTTANATSVAVQQTTYAGDVGFQVQPSQSQRKHKPFLQQQRDCRSSTTFQVDNGDFGNSARQHQQQSQHQAPPTPATVNLCIPNSVTQETHGDYPLTRLRQMMSVQDAPTVHVLQVQQHPLQSQQHLMHPTAAFNNIAIADHGEGQIILNLPQSREDALITPPHSNDMHIATMLNKEAGTDVGPPCETMYQGVVDRRPECPGPVPGPDQRQQPQLASAEQRQEMTPKYVSVDLQISRVFPFTISFHNITEKCVI